MKPTKFSHVLSGVTVVARIARGHAKYHPEATAALMFINDVVTPPKEPEPKERETEQVPEPSRLVQLSAEPSAAARHEAMHVWLQERKSLPLRRTETNNSGQKRLIELDLLTGHGPVHRRKDALDEKIADFILQADPYARVLDMRWPRSTKQANTQQASNNAHLFDAMEDVCSFLAHQGQSIPREYRLKFLGQSMTCINGSSQQFIDCLLSPQLSLFEATNSYIDKDAKEVTQSKLGQLARQMSFTAMLVSWADGKPVVPHKLFKSVGLVLNKRPGWRSSGKASGPHGPDIAQLPNWCLNAQESFFPFDAEFCEGQAKLVIASPPVEMLGRAAPVLIQAAAEHSRELDDIRAEMTRNFSALNLKIEAKTDDIRAEIDQKFSALNLKIEAKTDDTRAEINQKFSALNLKIEAKTDDIRAEIDQKFSALNLKITERFSKLAVLNATTTVVVAVFLAAFLGQH